MKKKLIIFILVSLMLLSSFTILKCGSGGGDGDGNGNGNGGEVAKWGSAIWGQSTWNP